MPMGFGTGPRGALRYLCGTSPTAPGLQGSPVGSRRLPCAESRIAVYIGQYIASHPSSPAPIAGAAFL